MRRSRWSACCRETTRRGHPGDGVGRAVMPEALRVLAALEASRSLGLEPFDFGAAGGGRGAAPPGRREVAVGRRAYGHTGMPRRGRWPQSATALGATGTGTTGGKRSTALLPKSDR